MLPSLRDAQSVHDNRGPYYTSHITQGHVTRNGSLMEPCLCLYIT